MNVAIPDKLISAIPENTHQMKMKTESMLTIVVVVFYLIHDFACV